MGVTEGRGLNRGFTVVVGRFQITVRNDWTIITDETLIRNEQLCLSDMVIHDCTIRIQTDWTVMIMFDHGMTNWLKHVVTYIDTGHALNTNIEQTFWRLFLVLLAK